MMEQQILSVLLAKPEVGLPESTCSLIFCLPLLCIRLAKCS